MDQGGRSLDDKQSEQANEFRPRRDDRLGPNPPVFLRPLNEEPDRVAGTLGRPDLPKPSCGGPQASGPIQTAQTTMIPAETIASEIGFSNRD
jgi:hypothetical protein